MRVLFFDSSDDVAGSARAFLSAARALARREHAVTLACSASSEMEALATAAGVHVVPVPRDGSTAGDAWRLREVLKEKFIEAAFVQSERDQLAVASAMRLAERGAVIRRIGAGAGFESSRTGRFASMMATARVMFSSEAEAEAARRNGLKLPAVVAPLGVDVADYEAVEPLTRKALRIHESGGLIACVYEPSARGRLITAMRAMALLAPRHPHLHLAIVGRGSEDQELKMHAAALGITGVVSHLGLSVDPRALVAAADLVWVAANCDAAAFGYLDAMALRKAVIADRGPLAAHYVADGITGCLVPPADSAETAALVASFLARDELRQAMGNAARARVAREFREEVMAEGFERAAQAAGDRATWAGT
ncbi:MAG: glycosyltransferase [Gemmatimonadaceae bacterium]|nr:glycosyltransferase [Gemmatimonadaceae bacterium]